MENRNIAKVKQLCKQRAELDAKLKTAPYRRNTIECIRARVAVKNEIQQIDKQLRGLKNCVIREKRPDLILRTGW